MMNNNCHVIYFLTYIKDREKQRIQSAIEKGLNYDSSENLKEKSKQASYKGSQRKCILRIENKHKKQGMETCLESLKSSKETIMTRVNKCKNGRR